MSAPKYSIVERERRFLVDPAAMPAFDPAAGRLIEDRYLPGTGLRLRRVTAPGDAPVFKLGKKYPGAGLSTRPMTNIYLDAAEYTALAGLVLAEVSMADDPALAAADVPAWCAREVTDDPAYAGGTLAIHGLAPDGDLRVALNRGDRG